MLLVARRSHRLYRLVSESRTAMLREAAAELTDAEELPPPPPRSASAALVGHRKGGGAGTGASPCASSGRERRMSELSWNRHGRHGQADVDAVRGVGAEAPQCALAAQQGGRRRGCGEEELELDSRRRGRRAEGKPTGKERGPARATGKRKGSSL